MASVFGIMVVQSVEVTNRHNKPYTLKCYDEDYDEYRNISSEQPVPVGTRLYWEHFYRSNEFVVCVID